MPSNLHFGLAVLLLFGVVGMGCRSERMVMPTKKGAPPTLQPPTLPSSLPPLPPVPPGSEKPATAGLGEDVLEVETPDLADVGQPGRPPPEVPVEADDAAPPPHDEPPGDEGDGPEDGAGGEQDDDAPPPAPLGGPGAGETISTKDG